jgi:tRNA(adenine34) deaminase
MSAPDELWMIEALREAEHARAAGEVPVGAVVVRDQQVIGRGFNRPISGCDPSAHAEILAIREAAQKTGNYRLNGCTLYVTLEPCAMCAGAIIHARLARLVYGAEDPKAGAVKSVLQIVNHPGTNHKIEVISGVLSAQCTETLQTFFRERRTMPSV